MREPLFTNLRTSVHSADAISRECSTLLLWDIAPLQAGETVKGWLHRAAVATGLKPSYVKKLRYQEVPAIPAHVADTIREIAERARQSRARSVALKEENDRLLAMARAGLRLDGRPVALGAGLDAAANTGDVDARQLNLPLSGWMR